MNPIRIDGISRFNSYADFCLQRRYTTQSAMTKDESGGRRRVALKNHVF